MLTGITAIHGRAEDIAKQKEYREGFDLVVSRAVANLSSLSEYCLPFVKTGGMFVPYKSGSVGTDIDRTLVVIEKVKETPKKYPRKAGTPSKEPIK